MEKLLFITDVNPDGSLSKTALETANGAAKIAADLGASLTAGLIGGDVRKAADTIAGCGADRFLTVSGEDFAVSRYSSDAAALEAIVKQAEATIIIAPANMRLSRALAGTAFRLKGSIDTRVSAVNCDNGALKIQRWYYRQRMAAVLSRETRPWFLLVDSGVFEPVAAGTVSATLEQVAVELGEGQKKTRVTGNEAPSTDAQTIRPEAELLFVAGAGWTKKQSDGQTHLKDAEKHILSFLEKAKVQVNV